MMLDHYQKRGPESFRNIFFQRPCGVHSKYLVFRNGVTDALVDAGAFEDVRFDLLSI